MWTYSWTVYGNEVDWILSILLHRSGFAEIVETILLFLNDVSFVLFSFQTNSVATRGVRRSIHLPMILFDLFSHVGQSNCAVWAYLPIFRWFWARPVMMVRIISHSNRSTWPPSIKDSLLMISTLIWMPSSIGAFKNATASSGRPLPTNTPKPTMFYLLGKKRTFERTRLSFYRLEATCIWMKKGLPPYWSTSMRIGLSRTIERCYGNVWSICIRTNTLHRASRMQLDFMLNAHSTLPSCTSSPIIRSPVSTHSGWVPRVQANWIICSVCRSSMIHCGCPGMVYNVVSCSPMPTKRSPITPCNYSWISHDSGKRSMKTDSLTDILWSFFVWTENRHRVDFCVNTLHRHWNVHRAWCTLHQAMLCVWMSLGYLS